MGTAGAAQLAMSLKLRVADVSWLILTFYVPLLWVSIVLAAWLLVTRRGPVTAPSHPEEAAP